MRRLILIIGGARSGKSDFALSLAKDISSGGDVLFVATARALDDEMKERIEAHKASRPASWTTLEEPMAVGEALQKVSLPEVVVIDCITMLVSNLLLAGKEGEPFDAAMSRLKTELESLLDAYRRSDSTWIIVTNEVGLGVVPAYRLGRLYRDMLGHANKILADEADSVLLMVAGIPVDVKRIRWDYDRPGGNAGRPG